MPPVRNAPRSGRRFAIIFVFVASAWLAGAAFASAHAYVVSAQPPENARLSAAPRAIAIQFDEPVELFDRDAVEVVDARGRRVDGGDARIDPNDATRVLVDLRAGLGDGAYAVRWRVISADTHAVHGAYSIVVGTGAPATIGPEQAIYDPAMPLASALRWFALAGGLVAAGAIGLRTFAVRRRGDVYAALDAPARRAAMVGCASMLAVATPSLAVQSLAVSGGVISLAAVAAALHSPWGYALIVRVLAAGGIVAVLGGRTAAAAAAIPLGALMLATFSASGHAAAMPGWGWRIAAEANDYAHLVSVAAWAGGVLVMGATVPRALRAMPALQRSAAVRDLFAAFTPLAVCCALVAVVTGIVAALLHVPGPADLFGSSYGRTLCVKAGFVAVLLLLGYLQFQTGRGRRDGGSLVTLRGEAAAVLAVLACTAVLIGQSPHDAVIGTPTGGSTSMKGLRTVARGHLIN